MSAEMTLEEAIRRYGSGIQLEKVRDLEDGTPPIIYPPVPPQGSGVYRIKIGGEPSAQSAAVKPISPIGNLTVALNAYAAVVTYTFV